MRKGRSSLNVTRTLDGIIEAARSHASMLAGQPVSLFVASDYAFAFEYLRQAAPSDWSMLEIPQTRPDSGVWFGEYGAANFEAQKSDQVRASNMQIAMADMLSLASCDLFLVPDNTVSSFAVVPMLMAPAHRTEVCFLGRSLNGWRASSQGPHSTQSFCYCNMTLIDASQNHSCHFTQSDSKI